MDHAITFAAAAFGGGLLVFVQFLITRHDNKKGVMAAIQERLDGLWLKLENFEVVTVRRYIFSFAHTLQKGERHNREEWDQVIDDIREYRMYCQRHPEFINNKCELTIEHIENCYKERLQKKDFSED